MRWRTAWHVASWPAKGLRLCLGFVLLLALLAAVGAIGLAWRLAQGPLEITWLARKVESIAAPGHIRIGHATLAWNGFNHGAHSGLELQFHDVSAVDRSGAAQASVVHAGVTLAPMPLLTATVAPSRIVLDGLTLRATRGADGALRLDLGGSSDEGSGFSGMLAQLRRPAGAAGADPALDALQEVIVQHATITLTDEASGTSLQGDIAGLDLHRREAGGITGSASAHFDVAGAAVALSVDAELAADGGTHFAATLSPFGASVLDPAALARFVPALARFGSIDTSIQAKATLDLSPALFPERATIQASAGAGTLAIPGSAPVTFDRAAASAAATWDATSWRPATIKLDPAEIVLVAGGERQSTLRITADATRAGGKVELQAAATLDHAAFADVAALWPAAWGGHVRPWLTENMTAGTAHDGSFTATVDLPEADPADAKLVAAGGSVQADDATIHWLRPVPPIEHAQATLTVTGPDDLSIAVPRGAQGAIALKDGTIRITGLSHKDQYMSVTTSLQGSVPDLIKVLSHPRLQLLSAHPIPISGSAGKFTARLSVDLPLFDHLTFDQVSIASTGRLTGLRLGGLVAGRDLDHGDVTYDVTQDGLKATGAVRVGGVAGQADVAMNFRSGPPDEVVQQARLGGRVGLAELAANGLSSGGVLTGGAAVLDVTYAEQRDGLARVSLKADLGPAGLSVAGWHKQPGPAAKASATVLLTHGKLSGVSQLAASGPGLDIVARAEMLGGRPRILRLDRVELGPTRLAGEIVFPADPSGPIRISANGPVLDLSEQIGKSDDSSVNGGWIVDLRFGRVVLGHGRTLIDLAAHAEHVGGRLHALQASTGGKERLRASITPSPGSRRLLVQAADTGALLRGLDFTGSIEGGALSVDAIYDDRYADPPLDGRIQLGDFAVHDAVIVGKLLQAITVYGIVDAVRDRGVYFAEMQIPFNLAGNVLRLGPSRAYSSSLGITATGWVDFNRQLMDLNGTVVPAYAVNAALGKLPWVGRLFSPERGGGLIAANVGVSGPTADPNVTVNPFSLLTPGILRRFFDVFG